MISGKKTTPLNILDKYKNILQQTDPIRSSGRVVEVSGKTIFSHGPECRLGELCSIETSTKTNAQRSAKRNETTTGTIKAEVIGFRDEHVILAPLENITGVYPGADVIASGDVPKVFLGEELLGRVIDGLGFPYDNHARLISEESRELYALPPNPVERPLIKEVLPVGIRAIDGLLTLGRGQRIGIFAGSGVGKSTLLGMAARYTTADINVIALIGERGREVGEFIKNDLGESGLKRSVVVVASSNESAMKRVHAANLATTIAEYFRDQGKNVLLMMDSITRLALAGREIGLSAGEPPTTKGFPPSVFSMLPQLLERAGNSAKGSITGMYTVLVEGDDMNEPISDALRGILDGHIVLSRKLASLGHYPSIDVLDSISRLTSAVAEKKHLQMIQRIKSLLAVYRENEEIVNIGGYVRGSNPELDIAIRAKKDIDMFLRQATEEHISFEQTVALIEKIYQSVTGSSVGRERKFSLGGRS